MNLKSIRGLLRSGLECCICLEPVGRKRKIMPCGHVLHIKCITAWSNYEKEPSCPLCRRPLVSQIPIQRDDTSPNDLLSMIKRGDVNAISLVKKHDCTSLLYHHINSPDVVAFLLNHTAKVSWFKTFNGLGFFDLAIKNENTEVINLLAGVYTGQAMAVRPSAPYQDLLYEV